MHIWGGNIYTWVQVAGEDTVGVKLPQSKSYRLFLADEDDDGDRAL